MSSAYRDSGVPLASTPATTLVHTPIQPTIYSPPSIPQSYGTQLQSFYEPAMTQASRAINDAYAATSNYTNTTYSTVTNVYNNTVQAVHDNTSEVRDSIQTAINTLDGHLANAINTTLTHAIDAISSADRTQNAQLNDAIHSVNSLVSDIHNTLNNQARIDLSPIERLASNVYSGIYDSIDSEQRNTQAIINSVYDIQARQFSEESARTQAIIHGVDDSLSSGFRDIIDNIKEITAEKRPILGISGDDISKLIQQILDLFGHWLKVFAGEETVSINQAFRDKVSYETEQFADVPHRFQDIFERLKNDEYNTLDEFISDFTGSRIGHLLYDFALNILVGVTGATKLADISTAPYYQKLMQLGLSDVTPTNPDISELVRLYFRGEIDHPEYTERANKLGFSTTLASSILNASKTKLTAFEYLRNTFTFQKNIDDMKVQLQNLGFDLKDIDLMIENYQGGMPPIQDLIRFMVRDTFSPIAETYGQFEDFPEKIMDFWSAQPIGDTWARHYWGAHWELPSIQQVIEMFQRRDGESDNPIVTYQELQQFLKAKDIMPFWRDKLTKVAYHPITRIDVRRIYNMGGKDRHWVYNQYLNAGYSPESANDLADFVVNSQNESDETINKHIRKIAEDLVKLAFEREIINVEEARIRLINAGVNPREAAIRAQLWQFDRDTERDYRKAQLDKERLITQVRTDYEKRVINRSYATNILLGLGHSQQDADTELKYSDLRATLKLRELKIDAIHVELVKWRIDRNVAIQRLQALGVEQPEYEYLTELWTAEREKKDRQLSETDVNKIFNAGNMTVTQYRQYMTTLGFDAQEIAWLEELHKPNEQPPQ